jgi:MerR family transcriptional regulator, redox-sensitive transcriptional activator SoxR
MKIGELAKRAGVNASAIRYYEKLGLLPAPERRGGQRRYAAAAADRLLLIRFAAEMDFTLAEIRLLLAGFRENTSPSARWKKFAGQKIQEIERIIDRATHLRDVLRGLERCHCACLHECVSCLERSDRLPRASSSAR